jgi:hypothetical protein
MIAQQVTFPLWPFVVLHRGAKISQKVGKPMVIAFANRLTCCAVDYLDGDRAPARLFSILKPSKFHLGLSRSIWAMVFSPLVCPSGLRAGSAILHYPAGVRHRCGVTQVSRRSTEKMIRVIISTP